MYLKKEKKRSHKKTTGLHMSFKELAQAIADAYKMIDQETRAWLDETAAKLLAWNKVMREDLAEYLKKHGKEEGDETDEDEEADEKQAAVAGAAAKRKTKDSGPSDDHNDPLNASLFGGRLSQDRLSAEEQRRYFLKLQAAKLSLQMQELQNLGGISPAALRPDLSMYPGSYPGSSRGVSGLSPFMNHMMLSPHESASLLAMRGGASFISPPLGRTMPVRSPTHMSDPENQSLLHREATSPKRKQGEEGDDAHGIKHDEKRSKTESQMKDRKEMNARARSHSSSPPSQRDRDGPRSQRDRDASMGGMYSSVTGRSGLSHDPWASAFSPHYSSLHAAHVPGLASLGPAGSLLSSAGRLPEAAINHEQLLLGYQLGLKAAAAASGSLAQSQPRRMSNEEIAERLYLDRHEAAGRHMTNRDNAARSDEVAARLEALNRLARADGLVGESSGLAYSNRFGRADAFTRSEFGLTLSDIEETFDEMKRGG